MALASLVDIVADAVITVDTDQRIVYFNHSAERIFGWPAGEVTGRSLQVLLPARFAAVHGAHVQAFVRSSESARLMGERSEVYARRKDGTEFPAEASISKLVLGEDIYLTAILRDISERKGQEAALLASRRQLRALSHGLVDALEEERRRIARELHDEAGQALTALQLNLGMLKSEAASSPGLLPKVEELQRQVNDIMAGLHRLAVNLRPASLDKLGLVPALKQYIESFGEQSGLAVRFVPPNDTKCRLSVDMATTLFRIAQEALTNVAKHAHATEVGVLLAYQSDSVMLVVEDNGVGFDVQGGTRPDALGLAGIQERVETMGGKLAIESTPGSGTVLYVRLPPCEVAGK